MPRADFYLIAKPRFLDQPELLVCELARKCHRSGQSTLILARSAGEVGLLDDLLWSFDPEAFIPHQVFDGEQDERAAILIAAPTTRPVPRSLIINLRDEAVTLPCERVLEVVPADPERRAGSRQRWKDYQARGFEVTKYDM